MPYAAPTHKPLKLHPQRAEDRPSACKRGYGRRWHRFRAWYLSGNPLCMDCMGQDVVTPATEAHHKVKVADDPSRMMDATNCRALCKSCHSVRTARGE